MRFILGDKRARVCSPLWTMLKVDDVLSGRQPNINKDRFSQFFHHEGCITLVSSNIMEASNSQEWSRETHVSYFTPRTPYRTCSTRYVISILKITWGVKLWSALLVPNYITNFYKFITHWNMESKMIHVHTFKYPWYDSHFLWMQGMTWN